MTYANFALKKRRPKKRLKIDEKLVEKMRFRTRAQNDTCLNYDAAQNGAEI